MVYDVVIIGGGVIGSACARALSRYRLDVVLLERSAEIGFGTSKANSGIIHAGTHADPGTVQGPLEWAGNQLWGGLHADLGFGFRRVGELIVAFTDAEIATLRRLERQGRDKGVTGLELWDGERVRRAEPNVSSAIVAALAAPTAAVVNPYEATLLLAESAARNGVAIHTQRPVTALAPDDDAVWRISTPAGAYRARFVLNAAGVHADEIARAAGVGDFEIVPRKGEEYLLDKRLAGLVQRIIFPCPSPTTKGILVIPTVDGTIMVGPTAQDVDSKADTTTTIQGLEAVFSAAQRLVPGISRKDVIASFAGLRPVADTGDFVIGPTQAKGFINAAGIASPGLTAAPAIAELLVEILEAEGLGLHERDDFEPTLPPPVRVADLSLEERARLAATDPAFAHLVCRCELVTEGEVVAAIERGSWTLDGVKFRTRAGMGRCQGGFCTWRVLELLARELGIPIARVTKRGGDSWLVCSRAAAAEEAVGP